WLVRLMSASQGCIHWHLCLAPGGAGHSVVATHFYAGSESAHRRGGLPHPKDVTTCAGSFEEFVDRFWLENELWSALHAGGRMPEGGREYLAFDRPRGPRRRTRMKVP